MADGTNIPGDLSIIEVSGLDQRNGSLSSPRGSLRDCLNFEVDQLGGLVGSKGYAKYDGTVMGPDLEQFVIIAYNPGAITGTFQYGELVRLVSAGLPTLFCICLGTVAGTPQIGPGPLLAIAYPYTDYSSWVDPTSFGTATVVTGMTSGATLSSIVFTQDMTDPSLSVTQYNSLRKQIQTLHSGAVQQVPGDPSHPIDCVFGFSNNVYAIHDCLTLPFIQGNAAFPLYPLEGHWVRDNATGQTFGRILDVRVDGGNWESGNAIGYVTLYDQAIPAPASWPPATSARMDLYDSANVGLLAASVFRSGFGLRTLAPVSTRALLYKTTDQQAAITTLSYLPPQGQYMNRIPPQIPNPRTWTRPRLTREMPYTQKYGGATSGQGFAPVGANNFSVYEYTRQGLTPTLQSLFPITAPEKFPTVATAASTGGTSWVNPNNIFADDGVFTTNTGTSAAIRGSGFDFSFIPPQSRIIGLSVRVKGQTTVGNVAYFQNIQLSIPDPNATPNFGTGWRYGAQNKGGTTQRLAAALTSYTFGGNTDLWGEVLTPEVLQDPEFGIVVALARTAATTVSLDCLTITVTYVPPVRQVFIRNTNAATGVAVTDIPINILHYSIDNGSFTDVNNPAQGMLTFWVQTNLAGQAVTEGSATNAGMVRVIGAGEEIWTGAGGTGILLGYTNGGHYPISFPPGSQLTQYQSRYEVINANFYDDVNARAAFIVNGVEFATMFDGTFTIHARTGRPTDQDNPRHVTDHLGYLHLGFASGAVVNCGTKRPLSVIGAPGSNTYNFGEPVTGLKTLNGQTLGVWTDRRTRGLQGSSPAPELGGYTPIIISPAIGCIDYMLADVMGEAVWMSFRGVETLQTVQAYGDFQTSPLSTKATPWLRERIQTDTKIATTPGRPVYACGVRNERQYKAFFGDGYVFTLTMFDPGKEPECTIQCLGRAVAAATFPDYGIQTYLRAVVRTVAQVVRTDGKEQIFAAFENLSVTMIGAPLAYFPYAVQLNCGTQFDIALDMPRWIDFNGLYFGDPQQERKFQSMSVFVNALAGTQMRAYTLVNFDGPMDLEPLTTSDPNVNSTRIQFPQYPAATNRVYLPAPQVVGIIDIPATGRMLRLRIDANQDVDSDTTTLQPRITHIAFQTEGERVDRS